MSKLDDILKRRDVAIAILQQKLEEAIALKNGGAPAMDNVINALVKQQADVAGQAYTAGLDDPNMVEALTALQAATTQLKNVAARMVSVTTFVVNLATLGTATNKVVSVLQGRA